jgi:circadian clock protein KaiC
MGGERNRGLYILKSRGMAHSNQVREFVFSKQGIELLDVYVGPSGVVLTGSARLAQAAMEQAEDAASKQEILRLRTQAQAQRKALEAQIAALQAQGLAQNQAIERLAAQDQLRAVQGQADRTAMARSREADVAAPAGNKPRKESHK